MGALKGVEQKGKAPAGKVAASSLSPISAQRPSVLLTTSTSITLFLILRSDLESG